MNEAFEKYSFPYSSPKKIFISLVTEKETEQRIAFQLKLDFSEGTGEGQSRANEV
jgi:hypothetical protein